MRKKFLSIFLFICLLNTNIIFAQQHNLDFNQRHTFQEIEDSLKSLSKTYPKITELFPIGSSHQENTIWCLKITNKNINDSKKTGIAVVANIHGGEQESAESALYSAIKLCTDSNNPDVKKILDGYIIYIVPVINPDGYIQSFITNTRQNLRPRDNNGDGVPFSDPVKDLDNDGVIAKVYKGKENSDINDRVYIGLESPDWDKNGILGDDPRNSGIDLNRTFSYQYSRYDIETDPEKNPNSKSVIGQNAWSTNGKGMAASTEPEVKALENFFKKYPVDAMATIHTGIQCVLYPWCYRAYEPNNPLDAQIPHMKQVSEDMANVFAKITGRDFYFKSSHSDYPTSAELIDYTYGRHKINSYTVEVYAWGNSDLTSEYIDERCKWNDDVPDDVWKFYNKNEIKNNLKLDPVKLGLKDDEGLWFLNTTREQLVGKAPVDQDKMVDGFYESLKVMIKSEKPGGNDNYYLPEYMK